MRLSAAVVLAAVGTYAFLSAEAAEVRVLSAAAVQVPVEEIAAAFARDTSHQIRFEFATAGEVEARVNSRRATLPSSSQSKNGVPAS